MPETEDSTELKRTPTPSLHSRGHKYRVEKEGLSTADRTEVLCKGKAGTEGTADLKNDLLANQPHPGHEGSQRNLKAVLHGTYHSNKVTINFTQLPTT